MLDQTTTSNPTAEITLRALEKHLDQFKKQVKTSKNSAPGLKPGAPREVQELKIESWAQVPLGLKALNEGKSVLWRYPDPDTHFKGRHQDEIDAIKAEQKKISDFISEYHDKSLSEMATKLEQELWCCSLFKKLANDDQQKETAKKWINSLAAPSPSTRRLSVSNIIEPKDLTDASKEQEIKALTDTIERDKQDPNKKTTAKIILKFEHDPSKGSYDNEVKKMLDNALKATQTANTNNPDNKAYELLNSITEVWVSSGSELRVLEGKSCIEAANDTSKKHVELSAEAYLGDDLYQRLLRSTWLGSRWYSLKDSWDSRDSWANRARVSEESDTSFDPLALVDIFRDLTPPKNRRRVS